MTIVKVEYSTFSVLLGVEKIEFLNPKGDHIISVLSDDGFDIPEIFGVDNPLGEEGFIQDQVFDVPFDEKRKVKCINVVNGILVDNNYLNLDELKRCKLFIHQLHSFIQELISDYYDSI